MFYKYRCDILVYADKTYQLKYSLLLHTYLFPLFYRYRPVCIQFVKGVGLVDKPHFYAVKRMTNGNPNGYPKATKELLGEGVAFLTDVHRCHGS